MINNVLFFRNVTFEEIKNENNNLDTSKSAQSKSIPFKMIKVNADIFANFILQKFNQCIMDAKFPNLLTKAEGSLAHRKGNHNGKSNYWPISILPLRYLWASHLQPNKPNGTKCLINVLLPSSRKR